MIVAAIDRDYLREPDEASEVGTQWTVASVSDTWEELDASALPSEKTRFRIVDDDDTVYYGGWLFNDDLCIVQSAISSWAEWNAGAPWIEVKRDGKWLREIS